MSTEVKKGDFTQSQKTGIARMRELFADHDGKPATDVALGKDWNQAWLEGTTPWDVGTMQPPLQDVMPRTDIGFEKKGHALVPGCGRGYDAVFLASLGYNTTGVDISPIAVSKANEWLEALPDKPANVRFELQNFFEFQPPAGGFDLIYDYTFFVALPPSLRSDWATTMARLVKPGGHLVALVFPIDGDRPGGPPYSVNVSSYEAVLDATAWEKLVDEVPPRNTEAQVGRARIVVWKKLAASQKL